MTEPKEVGYIARDEMNRMLYFVLEADGEAYLVHEPVFRIFLTQRARGCKISEIEKLIQPG